jgi:PAS domain S-box-containing protein
MANDTTPMSVLGSQAILASVINSSLDGIVVIDSHGIVLEFNPAAEAMFGHARAEAVGRPISDLIVPEEMRRPHADGFARYLAGGAPKVLGRRIEVEALRADGSRMPIELAITEARIGEERLFTASMRDLTERRAAAAALQASEARLTAFLENAPAAMYLKDLQGRYVVANHWMLEALGRRADEVIGRTFAEVLGVDTVEAVQAVDRALLETGEPQIGEAVFPSATGLRQTMAVRFPVRDAKGEIIHLGGVIIDMSEQKKAELQLRASKERFRALSEFHPVALVIMQLRDRKVVLANPAFFQLINLPADIDLDLVNSSPWYETPEEQERVMAAIATHDSFDGLEARMRRQGGVFWASVSWRRVQYDGEPAIVTSIVDITDRKIAEAELERSREALHQSEKLTALGSLLAGVSHELNNPLAVVVGEAIILAEDAEGTPFAESADRIRNAADRCSRIVQTFLAMARQRPPERRAVEVGPLVRSMLELTGYSLRSNGIRVTEQIDDRVPAIWGDPDQLHQVLANILINAAQALQECPAPRRLTIRTMNDAPPGTVAIEVADNGPGIPPEIARRIFEPFFTTKPQGAGTGVGLSFCQGIVAAHGGSLRLVPSSEGATFRIELPAVVGAASGPAPAAGRAARAALSGKRALVVDDEPDLASTLSRFLGRQGFAVDTATSGAAAKEKLRDGDYDVILSDLRMPDIDGPALHAWLEKERPSLVSRMAFVTGDTLGPAAVRFLGTARRPFISKPFSLESLDELLRELAREAAGV